jgi:hypothetical protein
MQWSLKKKNDSERRPTLSDFNYKDIFIIPVFLYYPWLIFKVQGETKNYKFKIFEKKN